MKPYFRKIYTDNKEIQQVQDNLGLVFQRIFENPMTQVSFVEEVSLGTGSDNLISHNLGQKPRGFLVASLSAQSVLWTQTSTELGANANDLLINIRCSANCVASLIFF